MGVWPSHRHSAYDRSLRRHDFINPNEYRDKGDSEESFRRTARALKKATAVPEDASCSLGFRFWVTCDVGKLVGSGAGFSEEGGLIHVLSETNFIPSALAM